MQANHHFLASPNWLLKNLVISFIFSLFFFILVVPAFAADSFNPVNEFATQSLPRRAEDFPLLVVDEQTGEISWSVDSQQSSHRQESLEPTLDKQFPELTTFSEIGSAISDFLSQLKGILARFLEDFVGGLKYLQSVVMTNMQFAGYLLKKSAGAILTQGALMLILPTLGFSTLLSPTARKFVQEVSKSTLDIQLRFLVGVSAFAIAVSYRKNLSQTYTKFLNLTEKRLGWTVGSLHEDFNKVVPVVATMLIMLSGFYVVEGIKSGAIVKALTAPAVVKTVTNISDYIYGETKAAFTETDRECRAREDKCADPWDKYTILAINYLPGYMADLEIDDWVINTRKKLFASPQPTTEEQIVQR